MEINDELSEQAGVLKAAGSIYFLLSLQSFSQLCVFVFQGLSLESNRNSIDNCCISGVISVHKGSPQ